MMVLGDCMVVPRHRVDVRTSTACCYCCCCMMVLSDCIVVLGDCMVLYDGFR